MISRDITIKNSVGLYARPATFFIQRANSYKSSIWIEKDDRRVNAKSLLGVLSRLVDAGNTVLVIEHNLDVIKCADWIIDIGPEGGDAGGQIVAQGTPEDVVAIGGYTAQALTNKLK